MKKSFFRGYSYALATVCACLCGGSQLSFGQETAGITDTVHHLNEVTVNAYKKPENRILRLQTYPFYLPVAMSSVSSATWNIRGITHIQDAVKFLPGAHMRTVYGAYQRLEVRGFDITPIMVDGVKDERFVPPGSSTPFPDFSSVESMELLKGPASVLHGQFAAGGILNVVRKAPSYERLLNFRLMYGSYDNRQAMLDAGGPLSHALRYRAVLNYADGEGFRRTNDRRMAGYLALAYDAAPDHKLEFRGGFNIDRYGTDVGLPPVMSADVYRTDGSLYLHKGELQPGLDRRARYSNHNDLFRNSGMNASLHYSWKASEAFALRNNLTFTYDFVDYFSTEPLSYRTSDQPIYGHYYETGSKRTYIDLDSVQLNSPLKFGHKSYMYNNQLEVNGRLSLGPVKYEYLAGYTFVGFMRNSFQASRRAPKNDPLNPSYDVYGPGLYSLVSVRDPQSAGYIKTKLSTANPSQLYIHGVYLQNIFDLNEHLKLMLAGRYDYVDFRKQPKNIPLTSDWTFDVPAPFVSTVNSALTYRAGIVYVPVKTTSIFASVSNFFQPYRDFYSTNTIYVGPDGKRFDPEQTSRQIFKPQGGYQAELGVKYAWNNTLWASAAAYYIRRTNERKTLKTVEEDGVQKNVVGQVGATISKGFEVEAGATPVKGLNIAAGYTYTHATVGELAPNDFLNIDREQGIQLPYVPRNIFYLAGNYQFGNAPLAGLGVNATLSYTDMMYNNLNKDVVLPAHFVTDVGVSYRFKNRVTLSINLNNIFDDQYAINTFGRQITPSIGRNYMAALTFEL